MKKIIGILTIGLVILIFTLACKQMVVYPIEPEISFKSLVLSNDTDVLGNDIVKGVLTFKVIDGDGDIGLPDDGYPGFEDLDNKNLFVKMLKKTDEGFIEDETIYPYRTPYLEPQGQDKSLVADFEITMSFTQGTLPADTIIKFNFHLYDRQLHLSNTSETPEIPADTIGTITAP